jgi:hypothetical protein
MIAELEAQIVHIGLYRNAWAYLELRAARQWVAALEANDAKRTRGRVIRLIGGRCPRSAALDQYAAGWCRNSHKPFVRERFDQ